MSGRKRYGRGCKAGSDEPPTKKKKLDNDDVELNHTKSSLSALTVRTLRAMLKENGMGTSGLKVQLVERLLAVQDESNLDNSPEASSSEIIIDISSDESEENSTQVDLSEISLSDSESSQCNHVEDIHVKKIQSKLLNPVNWKCNVCRTTESIWGCLSCGSIGCGDNVRNHANKHFKKSGHSLFVDINESKVYCYSCKIEVTNDASNKDIKQIQQLLNAISHQKFDCDIGNEGPIPNPRKLKRRASQFIMQPEDLDLIDIIATSQKHYRNTHLVLCFRNWQQFINKKRISNASSLIESDNSDVEEFSMPSPRKRLLPRTTTTKTAHTVEEFIKNSKMTPRLPILIKDSPSVLLTPGKIGLRNLGNSCFMNAVVQALSNNPVLRRYFIKDLLPRGKEVPLGNQLVRRSDTVDCLRSIKDKSLCDKTLMETLTEEDVSLCLELHNLWRVMWSGKNSVVSPYSLFFTLWKLVPSFRNYKQQDAEELLGFLCSRLDEELMAAFQKQKNNCDSVIQDCFGGNTISRVSCSRCNHRSDNQEPFFVAIPLNIPSEKSSLGRPRRNRTAARTETCSLADLICYYTSMETLDDYRCNGCQEKSLCQKRYIFDSLPRVLCFIIKRFYWGPRGKAKINTNINYPLHLDMSTFSPSGSTYTLTNIVLHHGYTLESGHYTAITYNDLKDQWFHCDDDKVEMMSESTVLGHQKEAYLLFYETLRSDINDF